MLLIESRAVIGGKVGQQEDTSQQDLESVGYVLLKNWPGGRRCAEWAAGRGCIRQWSWARSLVQP